MRVGTKRRRSYKLSEALVKLSDKINILFERLADTGESVIVMLSDKIDKFESKLNIIENNQSTLLTNQQQIMSMLQNIN